jgi:hypothetical protein
LSFPFDYDLIVTVGFEMKSVEAVAGTWNRSN